MLKDLMGKNVVMYVGFANPTYQGGASPAQLMGRILDVNEHFVRMEVVESTILSETKAFSTNYRTGVCVINAQYIIAVFEK